MPVSIRQLQTHEWETLKSTRLYALQADPQAFRSTASIEKRLTEDDWKAQLTNQDIAVFVLCNDDEPIGITYSGIDKNDPSRKTAIFWGSWIKKDFRQKRLSKLLYNSRIDWANKHISIQKIIITHRESNKTSQKAILSNGFKITSQSPKLWHDGVTEDEIFYERKL